MKNVIYILVLAGFFSSLFTVSTAWADDAATFAKLDQLEKGQEQILKELDDIKAELQIVKVRATLKT